MTEVSVAGGTAMPAADPETVGERPEGVLFYRYVPAAGSTSYSVSIARKRLTALLSHGDRGFIAESPELEGLGYGASPLAALGDLQSAVEQYLEVVSEGAELAPRVRGHADFLHLLDVPRGSWFAAVRLAPPEDAADLE
jgi:hypothetical protein